MAYIEAQRTHFDKKVSKEMRLRPIFNRRDIVLWTTFGFGGSPHKSPNPSHNFISHTRGSDTSEAIKVDGLLKLGF